MKIKITELEEMAEKAIRTYGYNDAEIESIKNVLLYAQLRGNNQGVVKLIGNGIPKRPEGKPPKIVKETPVSALVDGNKTHAIVVMDYITGLAIKKAQVSHIGIAGNFNTDESTGAIGYYASRIAEAGFIGFAFASSPFQTTAPYGSNEAKFCTNPLAFAVPTNGTPVVLDMSTSAIAYYGLIEAKTAGKNIPEGIGFDPEGKETTDPAKVMAGAIRTFGGHKGSGLAMMVQILAGSLVKASSFDRESDNAGNLVMAIDPEIFIDLEEFKNNISEMVRNIKSARKAEGTDEIFVPGERGNKYRDRNIEKGEIEIEENLFNELKKVIG